MKRYKKPLRDLITAKDVINRPLRVKYDLRGILFVSIYLYTS